MTTEYWRTSATPDALQKRAEILQAIRSFFASRDVLEVETPLLAKYSVTDPYMSAIQADNPLGGSGNGDPVNAGAGNGDEERFFLQTSPEYAMKRMLASGSGSIYQICKAFRKGELGSRHNPEFTMLEWYRIGFDHHALMAEVEALISATLTTTEPFDRFSYIQVFEQHLDLNPHQIEIEQLTSIAHSCLDVQMQSANKSDWLNLLLAEIIEPKLGFERPVFIYDYPADQAALAKIAFDSSNQPVAQRFELYVNGVELANGYHELTDVEQLQQRFDADREMIRRFGLPAVESDQYLIAAMQHGLPSCAGVALGFDRLLMLAQGVESIDKVLAFPADRA